MAYGDIVTINGELYKDITPNMTSNTTPEPYKVTCSSEYHYPDGSGPAYQAFADVPAGKLWGWGPSGTGGQTQWIMLDFSVPMEVDAVIYIHDHGGVSAKLQGSKGDGAFTDIIISHDLVTVKDFIIWKQQEFHEIVFQQSARYQLYRLSITSPAGWHGTGYFRFYQKLEEERYLLHDSTGYQTINAQGLQPLSGFVLSVDSIKTSGFEDIQMIPAVIERLGSPFDILHYSKDAANTEIQMTHLPAAQLVLPTEDIDLSIYSGIRQITLSTTGTSGAVRVIFSFDDGTTWKTVTGGAWADIEPTADTVITSGIAPEHVALIPSEQWAAAITNRLRIAYCLSKSAVTDDIAVDTLSITGNTASWKKAQKTVDYRCQLPNTGTMIIQLLKDGSYKINYMEAK